MKLFKKSNHCLFVEEETYNWAPAKSGTGKKILATILLLAGLFAVLVVLSA